MTLDEYVSKYPRRDTTTRLIYRHLKLGPSSLPGIARALLYGEDHVRRQLNHMRAAKLIYVKGWERAGTRIEAPWRPIWAAGLGRSAEYPKSERFMRALEYQKRKRAVTANQRTVEKLKANALGSDLLSLVYGPKSERGVGES